MCYVMFSIIILKNKNIHIFLFFDLNHIKLFKKTKTKVLKVFKVAQLAML